jgi:hypothetical protein
MSTKSALRADLDAEDRKTPHFFTERSSQPQRAAVHGDRRRAWLGENEDFDASTRPFRVTRATAEAGEDWLLRSGYFFTTLHGLGLCGEL